MYQVTLEGQDGAQWTVQPPCYGFMKKGVADCYPYSFYKGICATSTGGAQIYPNDAVPFTSLKYIWNSGTHSNNAGFDENPDFDRSRSTDRTNYRYIPREVTEANLRWRSDYATDWIKDAAAKLGLTPAQWNPERDYIDELLDIESYFDADSDSIITRHPLARNMFGVQVDNNVPADRALNYLMLARLFTTAAGRTRAYMWARYVKGLSPSQAIILAAVISIDLNWQGEASYSWIACSNDSCIYPSYIIPAGVGSLYAEPTQVVWKQPCYCDMNGARGTVGHLREENSPKLRVRENRTGQVKEQYGAMFMAIFSHREMAANWKALTIEVLESLCPQQAQQLRQSHQRNDIGTSHYSQNSNTVLSYFEHIKNACRAANTTVGDEVIRVLNTPLAQPAVTA